MDFCKILSDALKKDKDLRVKLAKEFEVALTTVDRMASGIARPGPRVKNKIINFIQNNQSD